MKHFIYILRTFTRSLHRSLYTQVQFVYSRIMLLAAAIANPNRKPLNPDCTRCSGLFCLGQLFNAHTPLAITQADHDGLPKPSVVGKLSPYTGIGTGTMWNQEFFRGRLFSLGSLSFLTLVAFVSSLFGGYWFYSLT